MFRESAGFCLAVDQLAIDFDVEDSSAPLDEFGADAELGLNGVRQTGGLGSVISFHAVFDGNVHVDPLFRSSLFAHACPLSFIQ